MPRNLHCRISQRVKISQVVFSWMAAILIFGCTSLFSPCPAQTSTPPSGMIEGVVIGPHGPVSGALVAAVSTDPGNAQDLEESSRPAAISFSKADGAFRLEPLKPGGYAVTATAPNLTAGFVGNLTLEATRPLSNIRVTLEAGSTRTVSGTVRGPTGLPLANAEIRAERYSSEQGDIFYGRTNAKGEYVLTLPQATYLLVVVAPDHSLATTEVELNGPQSANLTVDRSGDAPNEVADWIRGHAIPIATTEAGHGFADLQPLKKVIGTARLVELGEATHGTREFFQLKHRMLEFLVTEMGFNIFGIEATMPEGFDINDYVLTGKGDPGRALAALYFWTWNTDEVLGMIRWMQQYNADPRHARKVKFYGFDMQSAPRAAKNALSYLRRADAQRTRDFDGSIQELTDPGLSFNDLPKPRQQAMQAAINQLVQHLDANKASLTQHSSDGEWGIARQNARVLQQFAELESNMAGSSPVRDKAMAENIRWIMEHEGPDSKMVAWAHNGHVAIAPSGQTMGSFLHQALGQQMVVFGFAFNRGSFQAVEFPPQAGKGRHAFAVNGAAPGSLDATLAAAKLPLFALDLHQLPAGGLVADWFSRPHATWSIGAIFTPEAANTFAFPQTVTRVYDALLFVENTSAAHAVVPGYPMPVLSAPANLDFESGKIGAAPDAWLVRPESAQFDYHIGLTGDRPHTGKQCLEISREPGQHYGEGTGTVSQSLNAASFRGKRIRLSAWVKGEISEQSSAHLGLNIRTQNFLNTKSYDAMGGKPKVSNEWQLYEVSADIPSEAVTIGYSFALAGNGHVWLDTVSVDTVPSEGASSDKGPPKAAQPK